MYNSVQSPNKPNVDCTKWPTSRGSACAVAPFPPTSRGNSDLPAAVSPAPALPTPPTQRVQQDRPEAGRTHDVHDEIGRVVDAGNDVGRVQHDADDDGAVHELAEEREDDARRLADDEDDGDDEEGASESPLSHTAPLRADAEPRDVLGVDQQNQTDVEDEDDDDHHVPDGQLNDGGDDRRDARRRVLPTHPPCVLLRHAEEELVTMRHADAQEQREGDGPRPGYGTQSPGAVRVRHHDDPL